MMPETATQPRKAKPQKGPSSVPSSAVAGINWLRRIVAAMFIVTIIITWKLWISDRSYPLIPVLEWLPQIPPPFDYILPAILLAALAAAALMRNPRWPIRIVLVAGLLVALFDLTRWQPYILHYLVILGSLLLLPWERRERWTKEDLEWGLMPVYMLLGFTYLYSGLQKFNHEFIGWVFGWMLEPMMGWLDIPPPEFSRPLLTTLAIIAAIIETTGGLLLFFRRTRRPAAIALIGMHLFILVMLGPLGRVTNHAVWPWNIAMIATLWLLFVSRNAPDVALAERLFRGAWWKSVTGGRGGTLPSRAHALGAGMALFFFGMLPTLNFVDMWDSYLSFSIYSGMIHNGRIHMVPEDQLLLPPYMKEQFGEDGGFDPTQWAIRELIAAPYPEPRAMIRMGRELARRAQHSDVYVQIGGRPNIITGKRTIDVFRCPRGGGEPVKD